MGGHFFGAGAAEGDWMELGDRWGWSHVAGAVLEMVGLVALVIAAVI